MAKGLLIGGQNGGKIDQKADKKHAPNSDAFFDRFLIDFGGPDPPKVCKPYGRSLENGGNRKFEKVVENRHGNEGQMLPKRDQNR